MIVKYDVIIVGAGAAGLMCAFTAGLRGKKIALLDHSNKLAEKIRISGGGRCNFTNIYTTPECYLSDNPRFSISALSRYTPAHFCGLLDRLNIGYHEKTLGQLFCNTSSQEIINMLDSLCMENNVTRTMGITIQNIQKSGIGFLLETNKGQFSSESLVIASGGLALPQVGATGFGYNIAKQFGLQVIDPKPALVPLALDPVDLAYFKELAGTSFWSNTNIRNTNFQENTLLTHRGLSGPAILQISSYWNPGTAIAIDMLPQQQIDNLITESRSSIKLLSNFLHQYFPARLADSLCKIMGINKQLCQLSNKEINTIAQFIHNLNLKPTGTLGFKKAEVTKGGVDTQELSSKSMQANAVEGLYFIGEVVDVTGWLGGYNFQWAWASGHAAGQDV